MSALGVLLFQVPGASDNPADGGLSVVKNQSGCKDMVSAAKKVVALVAERGITLKLRHVKGHTNGNGRFWVNRQCDLIAKRGMKNARTKSTPTKHKNRKRGNTLKLDKPGGWVKPVDAPTDAEKAAARRDKMQKAQDAGWPVQRQNA